MLSMDESSLSPSTSNVSAASAIVKLLSKSSSKVSISKSQTSSDTHSDYKSASSTSSSEFETDAEFEDVSLDNLLAKERNDQSERSLSNFCIVRLWNSLTDAARGSVTKFVVNISQLAARNPKRCISFIIVLSFAILAIGYFTNFNLNLDENQIYAPFDSLPKRHHEWRENDSAFPESGRFLTFAVHTEGGNVLEEVEPLRRVFEFFDTVRSITDYGVLCDPSSEYFVDYYTCRIWSVTNFWNDNTTSFENSVQSTEDIISAISGSTYPTGEPIDIGLIIGKPARDENGLVTYGESYLGTMVLPDLEETLQFEAEAIDILLELQKQWEEEKGSNVRLEFFAQRSWGDEFMRGILVDLPLIPIVIGIMSAFACMYFFKPNKIQSRSLLGFGSVVAIALSIMTGYGVMFLIGVPFTTMTQMIPFIVFGVGLDDTFVITGEYFRTDPQKDPVQRIKEAIENIGVSITMTTTTTSIAFMLGCVSSIPSIHWLCLYAFPMIIIDFIYQITFFVAIIILDERRIRANKMDICVCCTAQRVNGDDYKQEYDHGEENTKRKDSVESNNNSNKHIADQFMIWYAERLMFPWVKAFVIVVFMSYLAVCCYCTTQLTQRFDFVDLIPSDSYVAEFVESTGAYSSRQFPISVYFRDVDQSNETIRNQMQKYVDNLTALDIFEDEPAVCWITYFRQFEEMTASDPVISNMTFNEKAEYLLSYAAVQRGFGRYIARDEYGNITATRCLLYANNINLDSVKDQIAALYLQRAVTEAQPINIDHPDDWPFFTLNSIYFMWEFYDVAVQELIMTTISGVVSVTVVGLFFMPHWTAIVYVLPTIIVLYIDLLGTMQFAGLYINAVSYVTIVVSIGLLVDFIMHLLHRFYESPGTTREEKVKHALETMGASILVGGISTFLGVLPLSFSTSEVLQTVFISFFSMVVLGLTHGLIFLPVVLSLCGPNYVKLRHDEKATVKNDNVARDDVDDMVDGFFSEQEALGISNSILASDTDNEQVKLHAIARRKTDNTKNLENKILEEEEGDDNVSKTNSMQDVGDDNVSKTNSMQDIGDDNVSKINSMQNVGDGNASKTNSMQNVGIKGSESSWVVPSKSAQNSDLGEDHPSSGRPIEVMYRTYIQDTKQIATTKQIEVTYRTYTTKATQI